MAHWHLPSPAFSREETFKLFNHKTHSIYSLYSVDLPYFGPLRCSKYFIFRFFSFSLFFKACMLLEFQAFLPEKSFETSKPRRQPPRPSPLPARTPMGQIPKTASLFKRSTKLATP